MLFRLARICAVLISVICIISITACNRGDKLTQGNKDEIDLGQDVTSNKKPEDPIFVDFEKNWRNFISQSPEFALAVIPIKDKTQKEAWQPLILAECVYSPDAAAQVPQVTLTWNEPVAPATPIPIPRRVEQKGEQQPEQKIQEPAKTRFDLTVHYEGFERNQYSTTLSTDKNKRFNLPSNSDLINQPEAVVLSGPSLFPKLMDFRTENLRERDTNREFVKKTLVLRDLSPGLTYTIRVAVLGNNQWIEEKEVVFLTPVCFKGF
jgi:hypothetical protein